MRDMAPKKEAIKKLIEAMKAMRVEKIKGYKKPDDEIPAMVAEVKKKKEDEE